MTGHLILSRFKNRKRPFQARSRLRPRFFRYTEKSPIAHRIHELLVPLDWEHFPERNLRRHWCQPAVPYAAFAGAMLVKINEGLGSMGDLRRYLIEHPDLIPLLGFPLIRSRKYPWRFDVQASLPTQRHMTRMLREVPNETFQFLLEGSAKLICQEFKRLQINAGECVGLDTKHILAWVKENNHKAYAQNRFDKTQQPKGDPDCKLGCKRRHNQLISKVEQPETPTNNPIPAGTRSVGEYYWGYGSGVIAVKVPDYGEFVLAELTQPFNQSDISYFFPLMAKTELVLGFKPRFGAFDAAFDAWYVYDYFYRDDDPEAFAAVPFSEKGGYKAKGRQFDQQGLPLCKAGLPMPLICTFWDRTTSLIEHERGKYGCPLYHPLPTGKPCPIEHKNATKNGCSAMMPTSIGARLRYTLERDGEKYKEVYRQRTATERINSQALALGIERPHIRNGAAITNMNTLIYTLINLRMLQRLRKQIAQGK